MTSPATPRPAVGLSERLRLISGVMSSAIAKNVPMTVWKIDLATMAEAAAQLDAQAARVKELEVERSSALDMLGDVPGETLYERLNRFIGYYLGLQVEFEKRSESATRAEQERDEAYERAAKVALLAIRQYKAQQEHAHSDGDEDAGYKESGSFFSTDKNLPIFVAAAIRRLAAGDEEGK